MSKQNTKRQRKHTTSSGVRQRKKAKVTQQQLANQERNVTTGRGKPNKAKPIVEVNGHKCRYADAFPNGRRVNVAAIFAPREHPEALCLISTRADFKPQNGSLFTPLAEVALKG